MRIVVCTAALFLAFFSHSDGGCDAGPAMKTVTDRYGKKIRVPVEPKRIACFFGPSYEKVFLLGEADKVAAMSIRQPPWAHKINPGLENIVVMPSYSNPDVERMLSLGIDLVFYWQWPQQTRHMTNAGIPVVCPCDDKGSPTTRKEFMSRYKDEIRLYGDVLGARAKKTAASYCAYYDTSLRRVLSVTEKIPESRRPTVYYITGRSIFSTQGSYSLAYWLVEMAGGRLVSRTLPPGFVDASMEQILAWDPEVILVGGIMPTEGVMSDPRWKPVRAVRSKRVYPCPEGIFLWGHGSSESPLFVMWLAKLLHPEKFRDLDLERETKEYYQRFYHYRLANEEVRRILQRIPPEGWKQGVGIGGNP
ncbi:MAG: ABC transporter substrate-binding protein [Geobacteraceae bacterium]|nr:ABC transporter substrate-binding protein [Geobacteraceae bacterium]